MSDMGSATTQQHVLPCFVAFLARFLSRQLNLAAKGQGLVGLSTQKCWVLALLDNPVSTSAGFPKIVTCSKTHTLLLLDQTLSIA